MFHNCVLLIGFHLFEKQRNNIFINVKRESTGT